MSSALEELMADVIEAREKSAEERKENTFMECLRSKGIDESIIAGFKGIKPTVL